MKEMFDLFRYNFSAYNIFAFCLGIIIAAILFLSLGFRKERLLHNCLLTFPALFFNTFFLVDAVTVDEASYIPSIGHITALMCNSTKWVKLSYQYRFQTTVLGTFFRIIRHFAPNLNDTVVNILYKIAHWCLFLLIATVISYLWGKYILKQDKTSKYQFSLIAVIYFLIGLPVCCLVLKVANYDAGNIYLALLAFTLVLSFEKKGDIKFAIFAIVAATCGCLEKWTSLIYYMINVALIVFFILKRSEVKEGKVLKSVSLISLFVALSCSICIAQFMYMRFLEGKGFVDINLGAQLFPMIYFIRVFVGKRTFTALDINFYNHGILKCICVEIFLIFFTVFLLFILEALNNKRNNFLPSVTAFCGLFFLASGLMGAYILHRGNYPFIAFPEGIYQPNAAANGIAYFYGAKTHIGHIICDIIFTNAMIVSSIPTVCMILLLFVFLMMLVMKYNKDDFLIETLLLFSLLCFPVFTLAGQSACPRYFGVSIVLIGLSCVYFVFYRLSNVLIIRENYIRRCVIAAFVSFFSLEMIFNLPLYNCFRPLWLIRSSSFLNSIRQGEWDAAEAMTWGEDLPLSGNWINDYCTANGKSINDITIVCDYGSVWYTNPGFNLVPYRKWTEETADCNENIFFVFVKFSRFRKVIPEFLNKVKPLKVIRINGEAIAWIYNGTQLQEFYKEGELK